MKIRRYLAAFVLPIILLAPARGQQPITFGTLIDEMTDLERLTSAPEQSYRVVQVSSYDRRSSVPGAAGWFANSDGFGEEPIPGFEEVLQEPDNDGIGTYLMCDMAGPGVIQRRWSAGIRGKIRLFLDNMEKPFYEGEAPNFFLNTMTESSDFTRELTSSRVFRQYDAFYLPIPFSKRCRIEWIGNIKEIHFYQVGFRLYDPGTEVETFMPDHLVKYADKLKAVDTMLGSPDIDATYSNPDVLWTDWTLPAHDTVRVTSLEGPLAIDYFSLKMSASNMEQALRNCILNIYFDDAPIPQVQAPIGDFFGAAPGINPYRSFPLAVAADGTMLCRFIMPFDRSARVEIQNPTAETIGVSTMIHTSKYNWIDGQSMHFRARWKIDHGLTASNTDISDIPYYIALGKGRIVGAAAFLYNPSEALISWGNWWGEGDEKIFIDNDTFPAFFGTGSEDYFNYSWSSERVFSFPYCGQPRNDGPGNRGYVSNYRWHISDDLPFAKNIAFYMELLHHGVVPGFSYGRIVYTYTLPGCVDDYIPISNRDTESLPYAYWKPLAYLGSAGYTFIQAEKLVKKTTGVQSEPGKIWAEGEILMWKPKKQNDLLTFILDGSGSADTKIGFTLAHMPEGGEISVSLNGELVKFGDRESISLHEPFQTVLRNHISGSVKFKDGKNELTMKYLGPKPGKSIGVDFVWLKDAQKP